MIGDRPKEKCGVFGIYGKGFEAARLTYFGLFALQHRGQESSGIAVSNGKKISVHKGQGLVTQVYNEGSLDQLKGYLAIGHNRYSTSGGSIPRHTQPVISDDFTLALAHNGNLPQTKKLEKFLDSKDISIEGLNDTELMHVAIFYYIKHGISLEEAIKKLYPLFTGAFCLVILTPTKIAALRDSYGIRPLSIGKMNGGFVIASETCAFDVVNAKFIRDVKPGELVVVDNKGLNSYQLEEGEQKLDIFEMVYFARPDSLILGKKVNEVRRKLGKILAQEHPVKADVVIPVPDSAIPAALGFASELNIPFDHGLIKNRYIHRTFIRPDQHQREMGVQMKLNPLPEVIKGKRVVVIDDSIVRGTTQTKIVKLLKKAEAKEVHVRISSPPNKFPDFYGIDTPSQTNLIGARMSVPEIKEHIGADSLEFLSYGGLIKATGLPEEMFCTSCFTGEYPIDIGEHDNDIKRNFLSPQIIQSP